MKSPFRHLSIYHKFIISLSIIFAIAFAEYESFLVKSRQVELYDDLNAHISSARVSMSKLEYLLDLFVVAWKPEYGTIDIIMSSVDDINRNLDNLREEPKYKQVWKDDGVLSDYVRSITKDLSSIRADLRRMNNALSQDEMILLHNSVDTNTVLMTDRTETLRTYISERRQVVFQEFKSLAIRSVAWFALLMFTGSFLLYRKVFRPIRRAARVASRIQAGEYGARFVEDDGSEMGRLGVTLNGMVLRMDDESKGKDAARDDLKSSVAERSAELLSLGSIMSSAAQTLAQFDVFSAALGEIIGRTRASAASIYMAEGGALRLKASRNLNESFARLPETVSLPPEGQGKRASVLEARSVQDAGLARALEEYGAELLVSVPIIYGKEASGLILVIYSDRGRYCAEEIPFLESAASSIAVASGHCALFQKELSSKKFLERLLNQMPCGLAVFDREGWCVTMNSQARQMLGADPGFDHLKYSVLEDDALKSLGIVTSITKSYEGYTTEFIINYSLLSARALGLNAMSRKLRIRSFPLYDAGGEISNLALIYEDLTESGQCAGGPS